MFSLVDRLQRMTNPNLFTVLLFLKCRTGLPQPACGTLGLHPSEDVGSLPISAKIPWTQRCPCGCLWLFCLSPTPARVLPAVGKKLQLLVEERRITGLWTVIFFYRKPSIYLFEEGEQLSLDVPDGDTKRKTTEVCSFQAGPSTWLCVRRGEGKLWVLAAEDLALMKQKFSSRQAELCDRENKLWGERDTEENVGSKGRWEWESFSGE